MDVHAKKRLEVIIEAPIAPRLADLLNKHERGYTMLPVLGGSGQSGPWTRDGQVSSAGGMVAFVVILDESALEPLIAAIYALVERHIGVLSITNCEVVRAGKF